MRLHPIAMTVLGALMCAGATSCFTGVESTPRIDASTVREQQASTPLAEASYLDGIRPEAPSKWKPGKRFKVADDRVSLIFTTPSSPTDGLVGKDIYFRGISPANSLTGTDATLVEFDDDKGGKYFYRLNNYDKARIDSVNSLEIPFCIDLDIVAEVDAKMRGKHFFVRTPSWYSADSTLIEVAGLRHVEIVIDSVVPGTSNFAAAICFHQTADTAAKEYVLLMSIGKGKGATRTFDKLFAFENPRKQYPAISDEVWTLITRSQVRNGMTRDECRLALGAPADILRVPTYSGMQERWTYTDGVYLIFDDGFLSRYRR